MTDATDGITVGTWVVEPLVGAKVPAPSDGTPVGDAPDISAGVLVGARIIAIGASLDAAIDGALAGAISPFVEGLAVGDMAMDGIIA